MEQEAGIPYRSPVSANRGGAVRGVRAEYQVQVVSPEGRAIPNALLIFAALGRRSTGYEQTVATDRLGNCTLAEYLLSGLREKDHEGVQRVLTVDIPGYAVGPVPCDLKKGTVNIITVQKGAAILGKLVDWNGNAVCYGDVEAVYRNANHWSSELDVTTAPDGTFAIGRIMPREPVRLRGWGN